MNINKFLYMTILLYGGQFILGSEQCLTLDRTEKGYWNISPQQLTEPKSQREDWYQVSPYIAEIGCTVSNLPFLLVAYQYYQTHPIASAGLAIAGTASAISHAIPMQHLNTVDKIGALASVLGVVYDCNLYTKSGMLNALNDPLSVTALVATGGIHLTDLYLARGNRERKSREAWMHVIWHLAAAFTAYTLLNQAFLALNN